MATTSQQTIAVFAELFHPPARIIGLVSFVAAMGLIPSTFLRSPTGTNARRLLAALLLISLSTAAANIVEYLVATFIIGTMIVDSAFLSTLAAIVWNRPWADKRPATEPEIREKQESELQDLQSSQAAVAVAADKESSRPPVETVRVADFVEKESPKPTVETARNVDVGEKQTPAPSDGTPRPVNFPKRRSVQPSATGLYARTTGIQYEREVLDALERSRVFDTLERQVALVSRADPRHPMVILDAIGTRGKLQCAIEVKSNVIDRERVLSQLRLATTVLANSGFFRRESKARITRGILVVEKMLGYNYFPEGDVACLYYDSAAQKFTNLEEIRMWIKAQLLGHLPFGAR